MCDNNHNNYHNHYNHYNHHNHDYNHYNNICSNNHLWFCSRYHCSCWNWNRNWNWNRLSQVLIKERHWSLYVVLDNDLYSGFLNRTLSSI